MGDARTGAIRPRSLAKSVSLTDSTEGSLRWFKRLLLKGLFGKVTFTAQGGQIVKIDKHESIQPSEKL